MFVVQFLLAKSVAFPASVVRISWLAGQRRTADTAAGAYARANL
jgi:hypothetical protein